AGMVPVLEGIRRTNSTLTEPTTYAHYLVIVISLLVSRRLGRTGTRSDLWFLGAAIVALATTVSRSGVLAMALVLFLLPVAIHLNKRGDRRLIGRNLRTYALIGAMVVGLAVVTSASDVVSSRFGGVLGGSETYVRVGYWKAAVSMASEHPWGVGIGNYAFHYPHHVPLDGRYEVANEVTDAHNVFLDFLAEGGFLCLFLFIAFLGAVAVRVGRGARRLSRRARYELLGVSIGLLSAFAMQLTFSFFYLPYVWLLLGLVVTMSNLPSSPPRQARSSAAVGVS
ncbi:MAG: O-antigen ligase family protein, partial [Acidimicrobiales bacterium]